MSRQQPKRIGGTRRAAPIGATGVLGAAGVVALAVVAACSSAPRPKAAQGESAQEQSATLTATLTPTTAAPPDPHGFERVVRPFFEEHCFGCHGDRKAKAGLRLTELPNDFGDLAAKDTWAEVVDMLNSHQMPPDTEPEPPPEKVAAVVDWVTARFAEAEMARRDSAIVLRRLNKVAYRNTLSELMGFEVDVSGIPEDGTAGGFDNVGSALTLSPLHMELYMDTARAALDRALVDGARPPTYKWHFEGEQPKGFVSEPGGARPFVDHFRGDVEGRFRVLNSGIKRDWIGIRNFVVPAAGEYIIRAHVAGYVPSHQEVVASVKPLMAADRERRSQKQPERRAHFQSRYEAHLAHFERDRIYDYGPPRMRVQVELGGQREVVDERDVASTAERPETVEVRANLTHTTGAVRLEYAYDVPRTLENFQFLQMPGFARPSLWIDWYELEGPVYASWPPPSRKHVLGQEVKGEPDRATVQAILARFMKRAYRRPVDDAEVAPMLKLYEQARPQKGSFLEAIKTPLTAVLVSPHFLYMVEPAGTAAEAAAGGRLLDDHELATRLSYLFWSSMPDEALFALAGEKKLHEPDQLEAQVDRMLADPKSAAFVKHFADQWLGLREVGLNPPVQELYPRYDRHLELSIVGEGRAFFDTVLRNDLPLSSFIRSDFMVINERLARFYGVPGVAGDRFRRVSVPRGVPRGGVLTQAAMLSITSNGTRTSPVKRGAWIMKNILGTDPGLPVSNAGEIAPKVPGIDRATVRQRLEVHRSLAQCARCHSRMDPLGFALENFNAAGEWRDQEGTGYGGQVRKGDPAIDASGELPDGTEFEGYDGLQEVLVARDELLRRCLASKLMTYAMGRELTLADQHQVDAAVAHLEREGAHLRSLLKFIVRSEPFRRK